jgi:uroporphyrinogen decarboxylase
MIFSLELKNWSKELMSNLLFQNAVFRKPQKIPPIWMMRQAGRYHKHYQKLREKYSFLEMCKIPELAAEVAFGPIEEFDFDVAILFSDILFPLEALGMGLEYTDQGPNLGWHLNRETFFKLKPIDLATEKLLFQKEALQCTRQKLPPNKSLIGFIGGPWTLFTYATLGKHDGALVLAKKDISLQDDFINIIINLLIKNIQLQLDGGAEIVMIFDTAAGELSLEEFERLVLYPIQTLANAFPKKLGYYSKGTSESAIDKILEIKNLVGIGIDHRIPMKNIFQKNTIGFSQGNFDQALLFREGKDFLKTLENYLQPFLELKPEERLGWVAGLGHGVLPKTPETNVKIYVETIRRVFS